MIDKKYVSTVKALLEPFQSSTPRGEDKKRGLKTQLQPERIVYKIAVDKARNALSELKKECDPQVQI